MTNPQQKHQEQTGEGLHDGSPELFPDTTAPDSQARERYEQEQEKMNAYGKEEKKRSVRAGETPELFPDTVAETTARSSAASPSVGNDVVEKDASHQKLMAARPSTEKSGRTSQSGSAELFPDTLASEVESEESLPKLTANSHRGTKKSARQSAGGTPEVFPDTAAHTAVPTVNSNGVEDNASHRNLPSSRRRLKGQNKRNRSGKKQSRRSTRGRLRGSLESPATLDASDDTTQTTAQSFVNVSSSQTQNVAAAVAANAPPVVPGAVAVGGINATASGDDHDGFIIGDEHTVASTPSRRRLPQAQSVRDEDGELFEGMEEAELVPDEEIKEEKEPGVTGWIKRHKRLVVILLLIIIGAAVGGAVGATTGGGGGRSPTVPTSAPTLAPTSAPTLDDFELVAPTLSTITPVSVLTDPTTPQNAAVTWLLREDGFNLDFDNAPKLLQRYALATIYFATNGPNWITQLNFLSDQDECLWKEVFGRTTYGVQTCNDQGMAVDLQLSENGLQGTLPNEVVGLGALVSLAASTNGLVGTIPESLFTLDNVSDIRFFRNSLVGPLPNSIGNLARLTHLDIQTNILTGTLPASIGDAAGMEHLNLSANQFSGPLPSTLGNLASLLELFLAINQLSGTVPTELSAMTSLLNIRLEENNFVGSFEPFCTGSINFNDFWADCLEVNDPGVPNVEPEVDCPCCTLCCVDGSQQSVCLRVSNEQL